MTSQVTMALPLGSDAAFRAWGAALSAAIAATGWIKTGDTGQIDWGTVIRPAANTAAGYEIFRMNDSLQATAPVYLKLEYGIGGTTNGASVWVTIGSATDGAGNFLGATSTRSQNGQTASSTAGSWICYVSGASNRLAFFQVGVGATTSFGISIERTKDAAGADTADGVLYFGIGTAGGRQQAWFPTGAGVLEGTLGVMFPGTGTGSNGAQVAIYPIFFTKGTFLYPGLNGFGYANANISALVPITVTVYGADHIYLPVASTYIANAAWRLYGSSASGALAMRWE